MSRNGIDIISNDKKLYQLRIIKEKKIHLNNYFQNLAVINRYPEILRSLFPVEKWLIKHLKETV